MFDLRDSGDADVHGGRDFALSEAELLAGLGELVAAGLREQRPGSGLDLLRRDAGAVQLPLQGFQSCGVRLAIACYSSFSVV